MKTTITLPLVSAMQYLIVFAVFYVGTLGEWFSLIVCIAFALYGLTALLAQRMIIEGIIFLLFSVTCYRVYDGIISQETALYTGLCLVAALFLFLILRTVFTVRVDKKA